LDYLQDTSFTAHTTSHRGAAWSQLTYRVVTEKIKSLLRPLG